MDPEVTRELEEQLRTLNEMISQQTAAITGMSRAINESSVAVKNVGNSANQLTKSKKDSEQGHTRNTSANTALQKAHEKYGTVMEDVAANFAAAYQSGTSALFSFTKAVLGTQEGFAKYNSAIDGAGEAAFSIGKNFGILGFIVGGILNIGSKVLQYQTQQADGLLNATDAMARMGAAGTLTTEQVRQMGKGAGLTSLELEKLTKPMQSVQGGFMALGGTQSEGIKKFGEMVAVSEDVRREFKRLGMGDQERNQALADFVTMLNKSGTAVSGSLSTQGGLQKAALAYTRNLYELAEMTGKDVETAKKEREIQMATMEVALQQNKWESDRINAQKKLESATSEEERQAAQAELERIEREKKGFEQFNNELKQAGLSQDQIVSAQNQYLTGTINRTSAQFAMWGVDMGDMIQKSKEGTLAKGELAQSIKEGFQGTLNTVGQGTFALAPGAAETFGVNKELVGRTTQMSETDYRDQAKKAAANVGANKDGTGAAAQDPALEARNNLTEAERKLKLKIDDLAAQFNPLLGNMDALKALGVAAAAAGATIALLVGAAGIKGMTGGFNPKAKYFGMTKKEYKANLSAALASGKSKKEARSEFKKGYDHLREQGIITKSGKNTGIDFHQRDGLLWAGKDPSRSGSTGAPGSAKTNDLQKVAGGGSSIETFLRGVTDGLSAAGKEAGNVIKGAGALAGSITIIGAGIAGATWILGKSLPTLAEGLKAFNKVPGDNLKAVGIGMAGLGAGMYAMGGGKVLSSIGDLISFFSDEEEDPLDAVAKQVIKMQGFEFRTEKVKSNANALIAFSKAMAKVSGLGALSGIGTMVKGIAEGITAFFGGDPPYQDFIEFSNLDIDAKKTKKNAKAFKNFAEAMASFEGNASSLGVIGAAIAESTARFFDVRPPLEQVLYFSKLNINAKKTKNNATAFKYFSEAMSSYKGLGSGLGAISTALAEATFQFFGVKPPLEQFVYFSHLNISEKKADINSKAFVKFSNAMASYSGGPGLIDTISTLAGAAFGSLFGVDGPIEAFSKFANTDFGPRAMSNSEAFLKYAQGVVASRKINAAPPEPPAPAGGKPSGSPAAAAPAAAAPTTSSKSDTGAAAPPPAAKKKSAPASSSTVTPPSHPEETGEGSGEKYTVNGRIVSKREYDMFMSAHPELAKLNKTTQGKLQALTGGTGPLRQEDASKLLTAGIDVNTLAKTSMLLNENSFGFNTDAKMPGSEIKAPLNTNSVLMKLAKTTEDEVKAATQLASAKTKHNTSSGISEQGMMNLELYNMITGKISTMLNILEDTNDTASKRLKAART